jgi:SAM-dependent methyltransferase
MAENNGNRVMNYDTLVEGIVEQHKRFPIDMLGIGDADGEYNYVRMLRGSYVRTVRDIDSLFDIRRSGRILEIGSFLGVVSISLKKMGYDVFALDIPEFYQSTTLRALYKEYSIPFTGVNLRRYTLPYEDQSFDAVVICEVMEHLNFNPLPILKEVNRVLKEGGFLYIAMPNQARIENRIRLLLGRSVHDPIDHYFKQLGRNGNMIVGLHWREYVLNETREMLQKMGFRTVRCYFHGDESTRTVLRILSIRSPLRSSISFMLSLLRLAVPSFRLGQVVIAEKVDDPSHQFWLTEANS